MIVTSEIWPWTSNACLRSSSDASLWSDQEWQALQPIWDYVDYLGSIPSTDPAYNQTQDELKRLYTLIAPLNKPQPVPGAFAELKKLADQISEEALIRRQHNTFY